MSNVFYVDSPYLSHHGVKGQRWGIRRYQNINGTLTAAGRRRVKKAMKLHDKVLAAKGGTGAYKAATKKFTKYSRKLYSGETKELIKQIQKDNELRSVYEYKKSEEGARRLEQGLKYVKEAANILSIGMTAYSTYSQAKNWKAQAKVNEATARKTDAFARDKRAEAAAKEYELQQKKLGNNATNTNQQANQQTNQQTNNANKGFNNPISTSSKPWSYNTAQVSKMINSPAGKKVQEKAYNISKNAIKDVADSWYKTEAQKYKMQSLSSAKANKPKISYVPLDMIVSEGVDVSRRKTAYTPVEMKIKSNKATYQALNMKIEPSSHQNNLLYLYNKK